jgi:hypothetical protein
VHVSVSYGLVTSALIEGVGHRYGDITISLAVVVTLKLNVEVAISPSSNGAFALHGLIS